jgi:hypothetical protein
MFPPGYASSSGRKAVVGKLADISRVPHDVDPATKRRSSGSRASS